MRLIDADKITFFDCLAKSGNKVCCHTEGIVSKSGIDMQPTVKAIPIEWIEKKALEFLMNRNFRWATDFQEVIDMWKVENNIPLFDDELKITREKENEENI